MSYLYNIIKFHLIKPKPYLLSDFIEKRIIMNNTVNNIKISRVQIEYYLNSNNIGYIRYRIGVGQIGLFYIDEKYRNNGLGKQILNQVIKDMKANNVKEIWAVTYENHPFWSNVYNKGFKYRTPAHSSVTGSGYYMKI